MAGIGFELRKLLKKRTYGGLLRAYAYAGLISSGPWVLSIVGIMLIGVFSLGHIEPREAVAQFQVSVTYLFLVSLIGTGVVQLAFTRFVADRLFEKADARVLPNFNGMLLLAVGLAIVGGTLWVSLGFAQQSVLYRLLFVQGLAVMSAIWIATVFLTGLKHYHAIVLIYLGGYTATLALALLAQRWLGLEGLMLGFVLGHDALLAGMLVLIYRNYRSAQFIAFDTLRRGALFPSLMAAGLLFNLGAWVDKLLFWYDANTGANVIGPLNASVIYDFPIFLSYLSVIPGMAVFLVRIETDFVEYYIKFYDAVREGATLDYIERMRNQMVYYVRQGLFDIAKIQAIAVLLTLAAGERLLGWLGISTLYLPLLYVDVIGAALQVVLLGVLNVLFYLDQRRIVLLLTALLPSANLGLTALTLKLGPLWYGYGFALAMLLTVLVGVALLARKLERLEFETFMLQ